MKSLTALDLLFGLFRMALAVFGLTWFTSRAGDGPTATLRIFWLIIAVFCVYTLLVLVWAQQRPESARRVHAWSAFIDLALITFLAHISGGLYSPFYSAYIFLTAFHAAYFGLGFGLLVGTASTVLYASTLVPDWVAVSAEPVRTAFLLSLPILAAFCCGVVHAREELIRRQSMGRAVGARGDLIAVHMAALAVSQRVLELHVLVSTTGESTETAGRIDGAMSTARAALEIKAYALLVADETGETFRVASSQGFPDCREAIPATAMVPLPAEGEPVTRADGETWAAELLGVEDFQCGTMLMAPVESHGSLVGALIACAPPGEQILARSLDALIAACEQIGVDLGASGP